MFTIIGLRYFYHSSGKMTYIFCAIDSNGKRLEIHVNDEIQVIYQNCGYTWIPKSRFKIDSLKDILLYCNDIDINFTKTIRHMEKKPVWIFIGLYNVISPILNTLALSVFDITKHNFNGKISSDIIYAGLNDYSELCSEDYLYITVNFKVNRIISAAERDYIYIFTGNSNIGKSYISHKTSLLVYETDQSPILPDKFDNDYDIIVIGNKYLFDIDSIISKISKTVNIIHCDFSKYNN